MTLDRTLVADLLAVLRTHERMSAALDVLTLVRAPGTPLEYPSWLTTETKRLREALEAALADAPPD